MKKLQILHRMKTTSQNRQVPRNTVKLSNKPSFTNSISRGDLSTKKEPTSPTKHEIADTILRMNFLNRRTSTMSKHRSSMLDTGRFHVEKLNPNEKKVFKNFMTGAGYESSTCGEIQKKNPIDAEKVRDKVIQNTCGNRPIVLTRKLEEKKRQSPCVKKKKKQHPQIEINSILVDRIINNIKSRCTSQTQPPSRLVKRDATMLRTTDT